MTTTNSAQNSAEPTHRAGVLRSTGDGYSKAFEFAATPGVFGGIGYLLDRWIGTGPWIMVGLFVFGVTGMFVKMWLDYDASMKSAEAATLAARKEADARHAEAVRATSAIQFDETAEPDVDVVPPTLCPSAVPPTLRPSVVPPTRLPSVVPPTLPSVDSSAIPRVGLAS